MTRSYPGQGEEGIRRLARAVRLYDSGGYNASLEQLSGLETVRSSALRDYFLLYRAKAHLAADRPDQAVVFFRTLRKEHPSSLLLAEAIPGECRALLKLNKVNAARALLQDSGLARNAETLLLQANIEEAASQKGKAIHLFLQIYTDYVTAKQFQSALDRLRVFAPNSIRGPAAYETLLRRERKIYCPLA